MTRPLFAVLLLAAGGAFPALSQVCRAETPAPPISVPDPLTPAPCAGCGDGGPWDPLADSDPFRRGRWAVQLLAGSQWSTGLGPGSTPGRVLGGRFVTGPNLRFDYVPVELRAGCVLTETLFDGYLVRGNFEGLVEYSVMPVVRDYGSIVTGPCALLRYNYLQPEWAVVPYVQGGAGIVYSDAQRNLEQRAIGQSQEFFLRVDAGMHWMLQPTWSLDLEFSYQHISNACQASRNGGVNSLGLTVGLTYYFPYRR
jgi:opacity protein-like surface antigen